jgi:hypothetical protein
MVTAPKEQTIHTLKAKWSRLNYLIAVIRELKKLIEMVNEMDSEIKFIILGNL